MSKRIQRVNALLAREVSQLLIREMDFSPDILVTVTRTETSGNLFESKVFISVLPEQKSKEVFEALNKKIYFLQQKINGRLKMRPLPKIIFVPETKTIEAEEIEKALEKLKKG